MPRRKVHPGQKPDVVPIGLAEPTKDLRALTEKSVRSHLRLALHIAATQGIDIHALLKEEQEKE